MFHVAIFIINLALNVWASCTEDSSQLWPGCVIYASFAATIICYLRKFGCLVVSVARFILQGGVISPCLTLPLSQSGFGPTMARLINMHICKCIHICICTYTSMFACIYLICICMDIHIYISAYIHTYMHICIHWYIHIHIDSYVCQYKYLHVYIPMAYIHTHTYMHTYMHTCYSYITVK